MKNGSTVPNVFGVTKNIASNKNYSFKIKCDYLLGPDTIDCTSDDD